MLKKLLLGVSLVWLPLQLTGYAAGSLRELGEMGVPVGRMMSSVKPFSAAVMRPFLMEESHAVPLAPYFPSLMKRHFSSSKPAFLDEASKEGRSFVRTFATSSKIVGSVNSNYSIIPETEYDFSKSIDDVVSNVARYVQQKRLVAGLRKQVIENCTSDLRGSGDKTLQYCDEKYQDLDKNGGSLHPRALQDEIGDLLHTFYTRLQELQLIDLDGKLTVPADFPLNIPAEKFKRSIVNTMVAFEFYPISK